MAATLSLINNFTLTSNGRDKSGKQGAAADSAATAYTGLTVDGTCHFVEGSLATATVITVYDDDNDFPIDWDFLYYWADQITYIQLISTTNVIIKVPAKVPYTLGYDSLLAAADATLMTGGTEPTLVDIDSVAIGNYSGTTANYLFSVMD